MAQVSSSQAGKGSGPNGFIELNGKQLLVEGGKIFVDSQPVADLFEDGTIRLYARQKDKDQGFRTIEELAGSSFHGTDSGGMPLSLPDEQPGPTGTLIYNGITLNVVNGRIGSEDHRLLGHLEDDGSISLRDHEKGEEFRILDDNSQLVSTFVGKNSKGEEWACEFNRPLYKHDRKYSENEILRYFEEYETLNGPQKKYVIENMKLWACSGILQVVRKSEGTAALGNVKHGAAGVTGVRTGFVTLDREEFDRDIGFFKQFGPMWVPQHQIRTHVEVRLNLVVAHEFGHQLEFVLTQATQEKIQEIYDKFNAQCERQHPYPRGYEGQSELLTPQQVEKRHFISGYARSSMHEYWAEAVAAFSVKASRLALRDLDPGMYHLLRELVTNPEKMMRPVFVETILALQASLRVGGELTDDLLDQ
jgi:hypothetical protein